MFINFFKNFLLFFFEIVFFLKTVFTYFSLNFDTFFSYCIILSNYLYTLQCRNIFEILYAHSLHEKRTSPVLVIMKIKKKKI